MARQAVTTGRLVELLTEPRHLATADVTALLPHLPGIDPVILRGVFIAFRLGYSLVPHEADTLAGDSIAAYRRVDIGVGRPHFLFGLHRRARQELARPVSLAVGEVGQVPKDEVLDDSLVELRQESPGHGVVVRVTVGQAQISVVRAEPFEDHRSLRLTRQFPYRLFHETQLHAPSGFWLS